MDALTCRKSIQLQSKLNSCSFFFWLILLFGGGCVHGQTLSTLPSASASDANAFTESKTPPHIIVIIADDLGFNDVSFHGSNEIPTPNIDALAYNGVILNSHYTQALCTPSRAAFLTGKYPIHLGMQHLVILEPEPWGLPLNETLLPERLKSHGYKTHAIGKWHLGFFKQVYTPTYRGFDSHYGYWQGMHGYYDHIAYSTFSSEFGYDMRRNLSVDWNAQGKYSTTLFTQEAVKLIRNHDTSSPMFMYFAHLAPHCGSDHDPLQAPEEEIRKFAYIKNPARRTYAAIMSMLDRSVGDVVTALKEKQMLDNSIIIFISDNGAKSIGLHANYGSNYPLRGLKNTPWEGAMRSVAAIWSPLIKKPQRVSDKIVHITDWVPTILSAAGLMDGNLKDLDGKDQWNMISEGTPPFRTEFVYNIDDVWNYAAIRQGDWKYVHRATVHRTNDWYNPSDTNATYNYSLKDILSSSTGSAISGLATYPQKINQTKDELSLLTIDTIQRLRKQATIKCKFNEGDDIPESMNCDPFLSPCLFNIREDPCEQINLASTRPAILYNLEEVLLRIKKTIRQPINVPRDPNADPKYWNGTWTNWQDFSIPNEMIFNKTLSLFGIVFIIVTVLLMFVVGDILKKQVMKRRNGKQDYAKGNTVECSD